MVICAVRKLLLVIGMSEEEMTFEEFNKHIDEAHDEGYGMCFSFHHYAHLDPAARKIAYLGFADKKEEYEAALADELERREKDPLDDNIYFLVTGAELMSAKDQSVQERIMIQVLRRANEMIQKKMSAAWVAVRTYAWMDRNDPILLVGFLEGTEDLDIWQVVMGNIGWDVPRKELKLNDKSLCLSYMRRKLYEYTNKAIDMGDAIKPYVVAVNGIRGMAALQDPRVVEVMDKLPRHNLDRTIRENCEQQIAYLTKVGETEFVPVLEQLIQRCQNKL